MLIKILDKKKSELNKAISKNDVDELKFLRAYHDNLQWFHERNRNYLPTRLDFELYGLFQHGVSLTELSKQYKMPKISILRKAVIVLRALQRSKTA